MESTANGDENIAPLEDESPFGDGEKILETVDMQTDQDTAAEEARKEEIRQQMAKVSTCRLTNWFSCWPVFALLIGNEWKTLR